MALEHIARNLSISVVALVAIAAPSQALLGLEDAPIVGPIVGDATRPVEDLLGTPSPGAPGAPDVPGLDIVQVTPMVGEATGGCIVVDTSSAMEDPPARATLCVISTPDHPANVVLTSDVPEMAPMPGQLPGLSDDDEAGGIAGFFQRIGDAIRGLFD